MKKTAPAVAPAFYCGQPSQCSGKFDNTKQIFMLAVLYRHDHIFHFTVEAVHSAVVCDLNATFTT